MPNEQDLGRVGRHGALRLVFGERDGRTFLRDAYAAMPMHFLPPLYPDDTGWAYAYLVNPTGGFVGGDKVEMEIRLCGHSHLFLTTQSATRVYRSTGAAAVQDIGIRIEEGAVLEYLPGYVIPFAGSLFRQKTTVRVGKNATAFIADSFTTGRLAMGEHLSFTEFSSRMEIEYDGLPLVFDRFILKPDDTDYAAPGLLESCCVCSTLYLIFRDGHKEQGLIASLRDTVANAEGVMGGVSTLCSNGIVIRLLGSGVRYVEKAVSRLWSLARKAVFPGMEETGASVALHCRAAGLGG